MIDRNSQCPVCEAVSTLISAGGDPYRVECPRCGSFLVDRYTNLMLKERRAGDIGLVAKISGFLRENPGMSAREENLPRLMQLRHPSVSEKAYKLLRFIASAFPKIGETFVIPSSGTIEAARVNPYLEMENAPFLLSLLSAAWAQDGGEIEYLVTKYLEEDGMLERTGDTRFFLITPKGWHALESNPEGQGKICFVAMWFAEEMSPIYLNAILPGIEAAGYQAVRIDNKEFNGGITDEIIAAIRTSKFVLADFTGHRPGVYYEAGFAEGLGRAVVRTVKSSDLGGLHFDTRHLNHIAWSDGELDKFRNAITARIVGTLGPGPLRSTLD